MKSFKLLDSYFFTILPVQNGFQLRVNSAGKEYIWPSTYFSLEAIGKEILRALTTASECRGESQKQPPASNRQEPATIRGSAVTRPLTIRP
jgi:hypothetical protein